MKIKEMSMLTKFLPILVWITLALTTAGCSGLSKVDVPRVLTSGRDGWQYPERVIEALEIEPGDRVAEIGAGSGYWLSWLSEAVGPEGRVYAVEVDSKLVEKLESFIADRELHNVEVILGAYDDPRLPDGSIDLAMTVLTYHHIDERVEYFDRLRQDLRSGGRVAHLDDRPDAEPPISWFQSDGHWTDPAAVDDEMTGAGYQRLSAFDFLPAQSFQIFGPTSLDTLDTLDTTEMMETNETVETEDSSESPRSASLVEEGLGA
jgi:arsenite methyltransferase